jgi:pilus assembly protein CpaB
MRNKRAFVAVLAVVLAVLGIASLVVWTNNARERAFSGTETVTVWQVTKDVPSGTEADAIGDSVEQVKLPRASVPNTALTSLETVRGRVTTASLVPGEVLVSGRFGSTKDAQEIPVPKGLQEVTVELASTRVLGGTLKRGERVGVLASYSLQNAAGRNDGHTNFAANRALVLAVTPMTATAQASGQGTEQSPVGGNLQVRLALPSLAAEKVVNAAEFGKVWLARQNKEAEVARQRISWEDVLK